jgi:WD40 repeat protein
MRWPKASGSGDGTARLWDLRAKDPAANPVVLRDHDSGVTAVAISADSRWVVTASDDGMVLLWDLRTKDSAASPVMLRHEGRVTEVARASSSQ